MKIYLLKSVGIKSPQKPGKSGKRNESTSDRNGTMPLSPCFGPRFSRLHSAKIWTAGTGYTFVAAFFLAGVRLRAVGFRSWMKLSYATRNHEGGKMSRRLSLLCPPHSRCNCKGGKTCWVFPKPVNRKEISCEWSRSGRTKIRKRKNKAKTKTKTKQNKQTETKMPSFLFFLKCRLYSNHWGNAVANSSEISHDLR